MTTDVQFADDALRREYFRAYDHLLSFWPAAPEQTDLPTSYGRTHVLSTGPVDAPPLVLLHGIASTAAFWHPIIPALAQRRRVHAVDVIGDPGRSVHNGKPVAGFDDLVRWACEVLDELGANAADVCGHSLGGHLALRLALARPELVRRLVLLDPARCFGEVRLSFLLRLITSARNRGYERVRSDLARRNRFDGPAGEAYLDLVARGTCHFPGLRPVSPRRVRPAELRGLGSPTLLVLAGAGELNNARRNARTAAAHAPLVTTEIVEGAGHGLIGEAPERTAALLREFLTEA